MREQMQVELIKLQRQVGITFVLVTHDQEEALVMSDRIAVMFEGEIAQLDDPEVIYKRPKSRAVADFIGIMNFLPAEVLAESDTAVTVQIAGLGQAELDPIQITRGTGNGVEAGLRPVTMTLLYEGQTAPGHVVEGRIEEVVYYGDMTYYDVALPGVDAPVQLSMRNLFGRDVLAVGDAARVAWNPGAVMLFR